MATRFAATVTAADISLDMRHRALANVRTAGVSDRVAALPYPDRSFDRVVAGAVTMFIDRDRAISELVRVCRPGGLVLATEFHWRRPPTSKARQAFLGEVCPGMVENSAD